MLVRGHLTVFLNVGNGWGIPMSEIPQRLVHRQGPWPFWPRASSCSWPPEWLDSRRVVGNPGMEVVAKKREPQSGVGIDVPLWQSHHPTLGDISCPNMSNRYGFGDVKQIPQKLGHQSQPLSRFTLCELDQG